jgi:hypothetical protein
MLTGRGMMKMILHVSYGKGGEIHESRELVVFAIARHAVTTALV